MAGIQGKDQAKLKDRFAPLLEEGQGKHLHCLG